MQALRLNLHAMSPDEQTISRQQLLEQWRLGRWAIPGQLIALLALIPVLRQAELPSWQLATVLGLLGCTWAWGLGVVPRLLHRPLGPDNYRRWRGLTLVFEACQSAGWGLMGAWLWDALSPEWHLFILCALLVFAFTALFFTTADWGVALASNVPIMLIIQIRLWWDLETGHGLLAAVIGLSMLTCLGVGRLIETQLLEAERLRLRNARLLQDLEVEIDKVRLARDEAEEANRQKSAFLAAASHDLRQPLHSLTLLSGMLTHGTDDSTPPRLRQTAQRMQSAVDGLSFVFDQLFDIARLDAGKQVHHARPVELSALLSGLQEEYAAAFEHKGLRWRLALPASDLAASWAQADPLFLQRILRNLLDNALRYTQEGEVRMRLRRRGTALVLQVWDTGPGIARDQRQRVFEDYVQGHNPQRQRREGLGLGLAMVRRLVAAGGYTLRLRSRPGQGSCFSLSVPAASPPLGEVANAAPAPSSGTLQPQTTLGSSDAPAPLLVLIDDDDEVLHAMRDSLQDLGWATACGHSAREAVESVAALGRMPQAMVCDWRLGPDEQGQSQDGLGCIRALRHEFGLALPAWLLTGDLDPGLSERCQSAQVGLLRKPLHARQLSALLQPDTPPQVY
jgi:two-component system, sensor histidine kinase